MCTCGSGEGCSNVTNASWQVELHDKSCGVIENQGLLFAMAYLEATSCHLFLRGS